MFSWGNSLSTTWESKDSHCEPEHLLETYRLQTAALKKELEHQVAESQQQLENIQTSKSRCEKHLIKLENECRRLDHENQLLREEVKGLKLCLRSKTHNSGPVHAKTTSAIVQATHIEKKEDTCELLLRELADQLQELQTQCREQGGKITSCVALLRKSRQDNEELREIVASLDEKVKACDCATPVITSSRQSKTEEDREEEYSRLLDEIQDLPDTGSFAEEAMFRIQQETESCLLPAPLQHKVSFLETQLSSLQQSLGPMRNAQRSCSTQTTWDLRPKRVTRNLAKPFTQKWSLLV